MSFDPIDRRAFLGLGGAAFFCTLANGKNIIGDNGQIDAEKLVADVPVPPRVAAAEARRGSEPGRTELAALTSSGPTREYWIAAEEMKWNIVPTHRDEMMNVRVKEGRTTFTAYGYRAYSAEFAAPLGPATIPGPLIEAEVGDTVIVHFRNKLKAPTTMHPHGIFYAMEMDGAYKGKWTDPGGFVQQNRTFTYVWEAREGTEGTWLYHDHGPMDTVGVFRGLHGPLLIRKKGESRPDREFFLAFHMLEPPTTGLKGSYGCINGRAFCGNTPTLESHVGERVAFHVYGIDNFFHTFHTHGHRWEEPDGRIIDNKTFGPAESFRVEFVEDNPGRWFYHCHVFAHLDMGMNGWYVVT
jgi:FtsP/CotA-like multicopper oxidase with cupredoxin domain